MPRLTIALAVVPMAVMSGLTAAGPPPPPTPPGKVFVYKESAGQARQMEVYVPADWDPARSKVPGLLLFHGGGWSGGSLSQFRTACHYFASRGLVAATANYRMLAKAEASGLPAGESRKRVCIADAKSAIRWMKQHADNLGIDPERLIVGGGSAGGHIAVLATLNPGLDDPADPKDVDTRVAAYVLFNPAFSPDDSQDGEVDVLRHLKPTLAPAIAFFGSDDTWKVGWDAAYAKMGALGIATTDLQIAPGQAHGFFNRDPWQTATLIAADRFLARLGFLAGEPTLAPPADGIQLVSGAAAAAAP